jgi:hypothetical protein
MASMEDLGTLKIEDFSSHLNEVFEVQIADGKTVPLKLVEAVSQDNALPEAAKNDQGKEIKFREGGSFTLQFVAPESSPLKQGIYPIKHPKRGTLEVFLVPTGPVKGGFGLHAVFG